MPRRDRAALFGELIVSHRAAGLPRFGSCCRRCRAPARWRSRARSLFPATIAWLASDVDLELVLEPVAAQKAVHGRGVESYWVLVRLRGFGFDEDLPAKAILCLLDDHGKNRGDLVHSGHTFVLSIAS